jgi:hypothetical protein
MTPEDLKILKTKLPKNWAKILSEKHGITPSAIRYILNGMRDNIEVIKSAIELAENFQSELKLMSKNIKKI